MAYDEDAMAVAKLTHDELRKVLNELLSLVTKSNVNVVAFSHPKWARTIGGAYPNAPLHDSLTPDAFYAKINENFEDSFWFTGDAFDMGNLGYMHGAYNSARRVAEELLSFVE